MKYLAVNRLNFSNTEFVISFQTEKDRENFIQEITWPRSQPVFDRPRYQKINSTEVKRHGGVLYVQAEAGNLEDFISPTDDGVEYKHDDPFRSPLKFTRCES